MTEPTKLVQRSIPLDRIMQEHGRVCLQLKFTENELENARVAIESLQKALTETQEKLASYERQKEVPDREGTASIQSTN